MQMSESQLQMDKERESDAMIGESDGKQYKTYPWMDLKTLT